MPRLIEEMADVQAALAFFADANDLSVDIISRRVSLKLTKFNYWRLGALDRRS